MRRNITLHICLVTLLLTVGGRAMYAESPKDSLATIIGVVQSENIYNHQGTTIPLGGCVIQVFLEKNGYLDSLYTISNHTTGRFAFKNITPQRIMLRLQCMGYETRSGVYDIGPGENAFFFTMRASTQELEAATVSAEMQLMKQIKDTTVFNTQAVRSLPGDILKDVLAQIPGFTVTDNSVSVDGVKVAKTYVNGVLIFGDDTMNALNALKADEVTQVRVYDEQSAIDKRQGKINSRKERVLDVVTNQDFVSLSSATAVLAGGIDGTVRGRYGIGGAMNYDSEMLNAVASAVACNYSNYDGYVSGSSGLSSYFTSNSQPLTRDTREERVNLFISKHWKNRAYGNSLSVNYDFSHKYDRDETFTLTDYFAQDSQPPQTSMDTTMSNASQYRHKLVVNSYLHDTPLKSFIIGLSSNVTHGTSGTSCHEIWKSDELTTKERNENTGARNLTYDISGLVNWTDNDAVRWRPRIGLTGRFSRNNTDSWTVDTLSTSFLKRQLSCTGIGNTVNSEIQAGVASSLLNDREKTMEIDISGTVSYNHSKNLKTSLDEWDVAIPVIDPANSYNYSYNEVLSKADVRVSYADSKKNNISGTISINDKILLNEEKFPDNFRVLKNFIFPTYSFSFDSPKVSVSSSSQSITPSIEQIRKRVSDTNPMVLTAGNPSLKQAYRIDLSARYKPGMFYGKNNTTHSIQCALSGNITALPLVYRNYIFSEDTKLDNWDGYIAKQGAMLYTWENSRRPSWAVGTNAEYAARIFRNKFGLKLNLSVSYIQNPMYLGENLLWMGDWNMSSGITISYKPSKKIDIHSNTKIGCVKSVDNGHVTQATRLEASEIVRFKWMILPRLRWETNYNLLAYKSLQGIGRDNMSHILNTRITAALLKDSSLELSLSGNDLISSPAKYSTQTNALYMTQIWQRNYGRYFIFSITYKFRKKK